MPESPSALQGGIGPHRRWSAAHAELADIKTIKRAFGGTVNDVVLAVIAGAFRELLAGSGSNRTTPCCGHWYRCRCGRPETERPTTRSQR